jgi:hypothetical protein
MYDVTSLCRTRTKCARAQVEQTGTETENEIREGCGARREKAVRINSICRVVKSCVMGVSGMLFWCYILLLGRRTRMRMRAGPLRNIRAMIGGRNGAIKLERRAGALAGRIGPLPLVVQMVINDCASLRRPREIRLEASSSRHRGRSNILL